MIEKPTRQACVILGERGQGAARLRPRTPGPFKIRLPLMKWEQFMVSEDAQGLLSITGFGGLNCYGEVALHHHLSRSHPAQRT